MEKDLHVGSLSGHRWTPLHCSNIFCFSKNLEERDTLYPNPRYCSYPSSSIFSFCYQLLISCFTKKKKTILFPTSKAERYISLYRVTNHSFCWTLALRKSRISWVLSNTHRHSFCWLQWKLGSSHSGSAVKGKVNSGFSVAWKILNFQHH